MKKELHGKFSVVVSTICRQGDNVMMEWGMKMWTGFVSLRIWSNSKLL
jgi:hypothetical protein